MGNLQIHVDGTVAPWLTRERHRAIVDSMLAHRPRELYAQVECPALLLVAGAGNPAAGEAAAALPHAELVAFPGGDHDLHAQHPEEVAALDRAAGVNGRLVIMGSGETAPTMVEVHRATLRAAGEGPSLLLDTPYGFQENADDITPKAVAYFGRNVGRTVDAARLAHPRSTGPRSTARSPPSRTARSVFAGPGSPTYALRHGRAPGSRRARRRSRRRGGTVRSRAPPPSRSASHRARLRDLQGRRRPRVGATGTNLLERLTGLRAALIPHYDNTEGGTHYTRFCYLGERRLRLLEGSLPAGSPSSASTSTPRWSSTSPRPWSTISAVCSSTPSTPASAGSCASSCGEPLARRGSRSGCRGCRPRCCRSAGSRRRAGRSRSSRSSPATHAGRRRPCRSRRPARRGAERHGGGAGERHRPQGRDGGQRVVETGSPPPPGGRRWGCRGPAKTNGPCGRVSARSMSVRRAGCAGPAA